MAEIDLIPSDYRHYLRMRSWLVTFAVVFGLVLVAVAGARFVVAQRVGAETARIDELRATKQVTLNQLSLIQELHGRKGKAEERLQILGGLRGGPAAEKIFWTIDRALAGDIWFRSWSFRRAGELVEVEPQAVETGYFIIVPKEANQSQDKAWRLQTHMEIKGQARDHTALAGFVKRLLLEPGIDDVRVINTSLRRYTTTELVDFELAVMVDSRPEGV